MVDIYTMGMDIGSATSKCVILKNGSTVAGSAIVTAGMGTAGPMRAFSESLQDAGLKREDVAFIVATGRGCNSFGPAALAVNELTAHAIGVHSMYPDARTLIDIGGHDARVMRINERGRLDDFIMNDKCAAGTGRFLEVMAKTLDLDVTELRDYEARAEGMIKISSPCTVFAESEVIGKIVEGADIPSLIRGICTAVAVKAAALVNKLGAEAPVYMSGGVARNTGVVKALENELGVKINVSSIQQLNGAYGAAVYAYDRVKK